MTSLSLTQFDRNQELSWGVIHPEDVSSQPQDSQGNVMSSNTNWLPSPSDASGKETSSPDSKNGTLIRTSCSGKTRRQRASHRQSSSEILSKPFPTNQTTYTRSSRFCEKRTRDSHEINFLCSFVVYLLVLLCYLRFVFSFFMVACA